MYEALKNNDIVLTNNKKEILNYLSKNNKILNVRIMTLNEFKDNYFGYYDEKAIYYLIKKYNYKYEIAKMYLDNFLFDIELRKELEKNNLIIHTPLFKESIKRIVIDNINVDPYIMSEIEKYEYIFLTNIENNYKHPVYEFDTIDDEVNFVATEIIKLLKGVNINKIHLVNVGNEYKLSLKRLFHIYNIPINLNEKKYIYGTNIVKEFLSNLKDANDIEDSLSDLEQNEIYNCIIDVINKYRFCDFDDIVKYCIKEELKNKTILLPKHDNEINCVKLDEINNDEYYFILGFNQGILPTIKKDEDFICDKDKKRLGLFTSLEQNINSKERLKNIFKNNKNLYISYKLKSGKEEYYPSSLIEDLELEIKRVKINNYNNSNLYNKIVLSKKLDNYIKYNKKDNDLELLYSNYKNINYLKYNNNYKKIDKELFNNFMDNKLLLSYSSIDNYYKCGFRYYLNNILKLNKYEETFMTYIGNLFHYILSVAFSDNFDFEKEFNKYIENKEFTKKEEFFINKLKKDLLFTINTIKKQNFDTKLDKELYEQKVFINKDNNLKITFMGVIDKLKYSEFDGKTIVAIIDYKTGTPDININNTIYGIDMQLPIYLYLAKNMKLNNVEIAGFYLQKIIHNKQKYNSKKEYKDELENLYKLEGYSNSNIEYLDKLDKNYNDSRMIKGMKTSQKGFYSYTKVLNNHQIDKLIEIVDSNINDAVNNIINVDFDINPKKIGFDLIGCKYCKYKDICYRKEEDIVNLEEQNYQDFLGGDIDA